MNIDKRNEEIAMASQNLEESFYGLHNRGENLSEDEVLYAKEQVNRILTALDGYSVAAGDL